MPKPSTSSHSPYFQQYINLVPEEDLQDAFRKQLPFIRQLLGSINEEKSNLAYAEGKWTLKELLLHLTDTERIFNYRALCIARKETASLPGFDENGYALHSGANQRSWQSLAEEFEAVRHATTLLFRGFPDEALSVTGLSNNHPLSVSSAGFIIVGHFYHHKKVVEERYLNAMR